MSKTPKGYVRLVHPTDKRARVGAYEPEPETGAIVVPEDDAPGLEAHGFVPEPEEERGQRAAEAQERAERLAAARKSRQALIDAGGMPQF